MRKDIAVKYAERLHQKFSLKIPVDLDMIANKYAVLKYMSIPQGIGGDGVSINLKKTGIRPTIIVNSDKPKVRQRFTLAHEIGHVLIPWHMGTIFDITENNFSNNIEYSDIESEANAFATELLMPSFWVKDLISKNEDIAELNEFIMNKAEVSAIAATLRLRSYLPSGYVFIVTDDSGCVTYSGRTEGTYVDAPSVGSYCDVEKKYEFAQNFYTFDIPSGRCIWVKIQNKMSLPDIEHQEYKDWRQLLEKILEDVSDDIAARKKLKCKLNGVFGAINGRVKRGEFCEETLFSACKQRFSSNSDLGLIVGHTLFSDFLTLKVSDLMLK